MNRRITKILQLALILCLAFVVGACSSSGNGGNAAGTETTTPPSETAAPDTETAKFPRTIKDATGEVTIEKEPQKVAVVHWGYTGTIIVFDIPSLAIALPFTEKQSVMNTEPYNSYADKIGEVVTVGENTEVNLEALLDYGPDVIIAGSTINEKVIDQLKQIATTVVVDETTTDVFSDWKPVVTKFGEILGQEEFAADYIADFQKTVEDAKAKLSGIEGTVAFTQVRADVVWLVGTNYMDRYYSELGLQPLEGDIGQEGAQLSLESLSELNPDHLFLGYFNRTDTSLGAATDEWEKSEVWKQLDAVKNNKVYGIDGSIALGYGPLAHAYGIKEIVNALQ